MSSFSVRGGTEDCVLGSPGYAWQYWGPYGGSPGECGGTGEVYSGSSTGSLGGTGVSLDPPNNSGGLQGHPPAP